MSTNYKFNTRISRVQEQFEHYNWRMENHDGQKVSVHDERSLGWYITLQESRVSLYIGNTKPDLVEGQDVTVTVSARE
jgi:hypothetical protein